MAWCTPSFAATLSLSSNEQQIHLRPKLVIQRSKNKLSKQQHEPQQESAWSDREFITDLEQQLAGDPDAEACAALLRRCARSRCLLACRRIDSHIQASTTLRSQIRLRNLLIHAYSQCGSLPDAQRAFQSIPNPNVFSWNILLAAFDKNGHPDRALQLFQRMIRSPHPTPDRYTFVTLLRSCSLLGAIQFGRSIHSRIISTEIDSDPIVATALLNMYGKCGAVTEARNLFDKMKDRDVISWNSMISAYALNGHSREALTVYKKMLRSSPVKPDAATFVAALDACSDPVFLQDGVSIHARIISRELEMEVMVATSLLGMYSRCGKLQESIAIFERMRRRSLQSWSAMAGAFVHHGEYSKALGLFYRMKAEVSRVEIDWILFTSILNACGKLGAFKDGENIVIEILERKLALNPVLAEAIMNMYTGCDKLSVARNRVVKPSTWVTSTTGDLHLWTALMVAYTRSGEPREALKVFGEMKVHRGALHPNRSCFMAVLEACGMIESLEDGRVLHSQLKNAGYDSDPTVAAGVISMYSKCGSLIDSEATFWSCNQKTSVVLWTTMIAAYGHNRAAGAAQSCFWEMCQCGVKPNRITLTTLLSACRSVEQVICCFNLVVADFDEEPGEDHFSCVIDLFGRLGKVKLAEELVGSMPFEPSCGTWMSLLDACGVYGDVELGVRAAENVFLMEPRNGSAYLTLGKIFAQAEMWEEVARLRQIMEDRGLRRGTYKNNVKSIQRQDPVQTRKLTLRPPVYVGAR